MRRLALAFLLILSVAVFAFKPLRDFETAIKLARIEHKKIILIFEMRTCGYCKMLNETTLRDENVESFLEANYITVIVNADENPKIFSEFGVRATPTMWFFEFKDGKLQAITYVPGYLPADLFLKVLKYVYKLPEEEFKEYMKKEDDFKGERLLLEVSEEDAFFVLKHDPLAFMVKDTSQYKGESFVYITKDEKLAKWLHERSFRVLLVKEGNEK